MMMIIKELLEAQPRATLQSATKLVETLHLNLLFLMQPIILLFVPQYKKVLLKKPPTPIQCCLFVAKDHENYSRTLFCWGVGEKD